MTYQLQVGSVADRSLRAKLQLFAQIASEPAYDQLRTKEQLGYIVSSHATQTTGSTGFMVIVQSEKDPIFVETRIEAFLDGLKSHIEEMSEEDFEKNKQSLITKKEETPKNLGEETGRFLSNIMEQYYEFGRSKLLEYLILWSTNMSRTDRRGQYPPDDQGRRPHSAHDLYSHVIADPRETVCPYEFAIQGNQVRRFSCDTIDRGVYEAQCER